MKKPPSISIPRGVRDILPGEAEKIARVESGILGVFLSCGFQRVMTPLLEYVDVLTRAVGEVEEAGMVKFVEPSTGKVVAIRPDITPQIARLVAARMRDSELPLKLCYNENVLRSDEESEVGAREMRQIGVEQISEKASPEIDAEMIIMAVEALKQVGIKDFKIDIGDVGFVRGVLDRLSLPVGEKKRIKDAIAKKDASGLDAILKCLNEGENKAPKKLIDERDKELLLSLTTFYGEEEVLEKAKKFSQGDPAALKSLDYITTALDVITSRGYKDFITIDLGEVRGFDYYTGIIFEGFAAGVGKPIVGGGRYDTLLEKFGYPVSSTGFAFNMENLVKAIK